MNELFENYLKKIQCSETVVNRVSTLLSYAEKLYGFSFTSIYISADNTDNQLDYKSLFLFTEDYVVEYKNFLNTLDIDLSLIKSNVRYFTMTESNSESDKKIKVLISLDFSITCTFYAYRENCEFLLEVVKSYLLPNFHKASVN